MKINLFLFFLFISANAQAQVSPFAYRVDNSIPVEENGSYLSSAWAGGLNATEYNTMDINFDGQDDLVLYDRTAQKVITWISREGRYEYAPDFEVLFPQEIYNWLLIRDFDGDGMKDIFTGHIFGISVYKNVSSGDELKWEHFPFYDGNSASEVVLTQGLSGRINLQLQFDDLPAISDADGDGDIDIFVMNYGGDGTVQFHKNFSVEKYGNPESLDFELAGPWWGGVRECECDAFAFNKEDCATGGRMDHAGGKGLVLMDADGDGFQDLLITEGECNVMNMLNNDGPVDAPMIQDAPAYPLGIAEEFNLYPTGYFEDVDFDGVKDFVVSTNIFSKSSYDIDLKASNWFYRNSGTNESPVLALVTKTFLQGSMIDAGDNVVPAFFDVDADGDFDMFISNNDLPSTVRLYLNIGTAFEPQFQLNDDDYLGLSSSRFTMMKIQFGDINSDGRTDLLLTATDHERSFTDVFYVLNKKSSGLDLAGQTVNRLNFQVAKGENISVLHVDSDGHVDILKGKSNGAVEFWKNATAMQFVLQDSEYLGMGPDILTTRRSFASADLDGDGKPELVMGDETGVVKILSNFRNAESLDANEGSIVLNELTGTYHAADLGGRIWPTTVDLYGTGKPVIAVGSILGGVRILRRVDDEAPMLLLSVYPNPVAPTLEKLTITSTQAGTLQIFSAKGDQLRPAISVPEKQVLKLSLDGFAAGIYLLRFSIGNKIHIRRLVVY